MAAIALDKEFMQHWLKLSDTEKQRFYMSQKTMFLQKRMRMQFPSTTTTKI